LWEDGFGDRVAGFSEGFRRGRWRTEVRHS
jgi:hypothetical protein